MALRPGTRTAHCWGAVGALALPHRPTGSGEAERAFPSGPAKGAALWLSVPETVQFIAGALWGYGRFRITQLEAGKPGGLFRQSPPGALIYGFRPGNRTVHCWAQWGAGRFHTASPEAGKPRRLFRQSPPGTLFYGSLTR